MDVGSDEAKDLDDLMDSKDENEPPSPNHPVAMNTDEKVVVICHVQLPPHHKDA